MTRAQDEIIAIYKSAPQTALEAICSLACESITEKHQNNCFQLPFAAKFKEIKHTPFFEAPSNTLISRAQLINSDHHAPSMLAIDSQATRQILSLFLGPKTNEGEIGRELSDFERHIVASFLTQILSEISLHFKEWDSLAPQIKWGSWPEGDLRIDHNTLIFSFEIDTHKDQGGLIHLAIAYDSLEVWWPKLSQRFYGYKWGRDNHWAEHWTSVLQDCEMRHEFHINYPSFSCRIGEVTSWDVGSYIPIEASKIAQALCHNIELMEGTIGHKNGHLAFQFDHWAQAGEIV